MDHLQAGDDHSLDNLAAIHEVPCHRRKSAAEGARISNVKRPKRIRTPDPHPGVVRD